MKTLQISNLIVIPITYEDIHRHLKMYFTLYTFIQIYI